MKRAARASKVFRIAALLLVAPVQLLQADVFYSGLRDIALPTGFDGIYLNIDNGAMTNSSGWDLNIAFGGARVYNNDSFQPARVGNHFEDPIIALVAGATVSGSGLAYSSGPGASGNHLGPAAHQFQPGQEEYLGFRFTTDANSGPHYGWMRVVFTADNPGGLIKDWAYETGLVGSVPGSTTTGNILQAAPSGGVSVVTLTADTGQASTLGSVVTNTGGGNVTAVSKTGAGTWTLSGTHTYTGATTVQAGGGTLEVGAANGKVSGTASITVNSGGTLLLSGPGGTNVKLNSAAPVTLAGGKIDLSGMTSPLSQTVGPLILSGISSATTAEPSAGDSEYAGGGEPQMIDIAEVEMRETAVDVDQTVGAVTLATNWTSAFRAQAVSNLTRSADDAPRMTLAGGRVTSDNTTARFEDLLSEQSTTASASTLNFGSLLSGNTWKFGASNGDWSGLQLSILNYTPGVDHLFFGSSTTALNTAQLDRILFYGDGGTDFLGSARWSGGTGEVVPVPEPGTWAAGSLAFAALIYMQRRRCRSQAPS